MNFHGYNVLAFTTSMSKQFYGLDIGISIGHATVMIARIRLLLRNFAQTRNEIRRDDDENSQP